MFYVIKENFQALFIRPKTRNWSPDILNQWKSFNKSTWH